MATLPESVIITVDQNLSHHGEGGMLTTTNKIELVCFSKRQFKKTYGIQQGVAQALIEMRANREKIQKALSVKSEELTPEKIEKQKKEKAEKEEAEKNKPEDAAEDSDFMKSCLKFSTVDIEPLVDAFEKLALSGCVKIGGHNLVEPQLDELDPETQEDMFFGYLANFIMPLAI